MKNLFPKWLNSLPTMALFGATSTLILIVAGFWYYATPSFWEVGYSPRQPVAFSHQIHAGMLGMDCRYCHSNVEESYTANIPSVSTCMNCHAVADQMSGLLRKAVTVDGSTASPHWVSRDLRTLRQHAAEGAAVPWRRVHKLPDYVRFPHAVHVNAGVSCYSCHSRIDQMPVVHQAKNLAMGWCLECHRAPEGDLVDVHGALGEATQVTNLFAVQKQLAAPDHAETIGRRLAERLRSAPPENCGACHY